MLNAELDGATIVLVGSFNPSIFQPWWFASHGLIARDEAESIKPAVIHPEVTDFSSDWYRLQVTSKRFLAYTDKPAQAVLVRDLVVGTFTLLEHTPVTAMGMHREMHFRVEDESAYHTIGDRLAPKDFWRPLFAGEPRLGLRSLVIQGKREKTRAEYTLLKVEPSTVVKPRGVFIQAHEHYEPKPTTPESPSVLPDLLNIVQSDWEPLLDYGWRAAAEVMAISDREISR